MLDRDLLFAEYGLSEVQKVLHMTVGAEDTSVVFHK